MKDWLLKESQCQEKSFRNTGSSMQNFSAVDGTFAKERTSIETLWSGFVKEAAATTSFTLWLGALLVHHPQHKADHAAGDSTHDGSYDDIDDRRDVVLVDVHKRQEH